MTDATKKYKRTNKILSFFSILLNCAPILTYTVIAFASGSVKQVTALGIALTMAIMFTIINLVFKHHIRSTIWILLLGIYVCLKNITPLLILIAACTMIDEFAITPIRKKYKQLYTINKEIDKRL